MSRLLPRLLLAGLFSAAILPAQPERPGVAEATAALAKAPQAELDAACGRVVVPEQRGETDDTKDRMVLYGLAMRAGSDAALRVRLETAFCHQLAADRPDSVKAFFLDRLQPIASPACVDAVAPLLPKPSLADLSARVLVSVGDDRAAAVLRSALPSSKGFVQLAIAKALGELADADSVPELLKLVRAENRELRLAAGKALAATGDPRAASPLLEMTKAKSRYERSQADAAYLLFLRRSARAGQQATAVQQAIAFATARPQDPQIHCAAVEVCGSTDEDAAVEFVLDGLVAEEKRVRECASRTLGKLPEGKVTPQLVAMLNAAQPAKQAELIRTLGTMRAGSALGAVKARLASPEASVRQAAVAAMAQIAGSAAVPDLVGLLAGPDGAAARDALLGVSDPAVGKALVAAAKDAQPAQAARLLAIVAQRLDDEAPAVLALASHKAPEVRMAALQALASLAGAEEADGLAARVLRSADKKERNAAAHALTAVCKRANDAQRTAPPVLDALGKADDDAAQALLGVLPAIGDSGSLAAATARLASQNANTKRKAIETLAAWPTPAALPALRTVVTDDQDTVRYVLAFRGLARLTGALDKPANELVAEYGAAMKLARRPEEKRLVLAGLGSIHDRAAFPELLARLDDAQLATDATVAIIELAKTVKGDDAIGALKLVLAKAKDEDLRKRAKDTLSDIAKFAGCVGIWEVAGPYTKDNKGHTAIYPIVFPPETKDAKGVVWRKVKADRQDGHLDLIPLCGTSNRCAYMRVNIVVPETCDAELSVGSDDGVKVWLNGNVCHENNVPRAYAAFEDTIPVTLLRGTNTLMMKVTQGGGGWEANARVRAADGSPLTGLNFELGEPVYREAPPRQLAEGAPTAEELGWRMSIQCWSFRQFTFFESVDKAKRMGVRYLEMFPGQVVAKEFGNAKTNEGMSAEVQKAVQDRLAEAGIQVVNFGVTGIPGDEAGRRRLFAWAKSMGIETICAEPDPKDLPGIDKLCQEYGINVALHNHPTPSRYWDPQTVLDACQGLSPRVGACADTGHWMRSGIKPIDAVRLLKGRIVTFHFKDLNTYGKEGAHDVPWGTGKGELVELLRELRRQGVKAAFSSEYEYDWEKNEVDIAACVRNFEAMARQIQLEENGTWQVLFNMRDRDSFMDAAGQPPRAPWRIQGADLAMTGKGGDIWTRERFGDFVLDLEFKTTGNSGLFFRTDNPRDPVQTGIEMQVERPGGPNRHSVGAFYDLQAPSKNAATDGWNHVTLTASGNTLTVVLNGVEVNKLDLDRWSTPEQNPDGSKNKFKKALKDFKREGHIGFQDHGNPVRYRNIRIRKLATGK